MAQEFPIFSVSPSVKHWPLAFAAAGFLALTGAATLVLQLFSPFNAISLACAGVLLLLWPALKIGLTQYEVTSARVIARTGLFKKERAVAIAEIKDIRVEWDRWGQALGVGALHVDAGAASLRLEGVEDPEGVREQILKLK